MGRVGRPHGLAGEVVVQLWSPRPERLLPGTTIWADGGRRPLQVASCRSQRDRYLVRFEGVTDRPGAESMRGLALEAPPLEDPPFEDGGALWVHELVGAEVRSVGGEVLGRVAAVEPSPASDLLVLEGGALVPLVFVVAHDPGRQVTVDVPAGLLDL